MATALDLQMYALLWVVPSLSSTPFWDSHPGSQLTHFASQGPGTGLGGMALALGSGTLWRCGEVFFWCLRMPGGLGVRGHGQGGSAGNETKSKS